MGRGIATVARANCRWQVEIEEMTSTTSRSRARSRLERTSWIATGKPAWRKTPQVNAVDLVTAVQVKESLRILPLAADSAARNMAIDEALVQADLFDRPTLRFYKWTDQAVSIGTAQRVRQDLRLDRIDDCGIALVRRASGGTAIYHQHQLGISLAVGNGHRLNSPDITESYRPFGQLLSTAFASLGVDARPIPIKKARGMRSDGPQSRCCLAGGNPYEPFAQGRKVAGFAQIRRRDHSLIHAIIPLRFEPTKWASFLASEPWTESELAESLALAVAGLDAIAGREIVARELCDAVCASFEAAGFELEAGELSVEEKQLAVKLYQERYSQPSWTYRL